MNPSTVHIQRKIIHFDADGFYAAVEMRDNPTPVSYKHLTLPTK